MKIAFIVNEFPSLSQTFVLNQITGLIARGHKIDIYAERRIYEESIHDDVLKYGLLEKTHYLTYPSKKLVRWRKGLTFFLRNFPLQPLALLRTINLFAHGRKATSLVLLFQMMPFLKNGPYDILHCQFGMLGPQVLLWKEIAGWNSKLIVSFRGYDATRYLQNNPSAYKNLFKYGDRFLPVCQYLRTIIIQNGCPIEKTEILRSGIDSHQFSFEEKIEEIQGPASILSVGRLVEKKGFQYALAAIALLIKKGKLLRYSIVGEGPLHRELESMIERLGIQAHVQLLGAKKQATVVQLMRCSHILIAPSVVAKNGDQEGIPNVLKEGMAMGLPVVSTYHSGIPELIEDGISGFLVPEHDVASLANRIEFLLDHPQKRIAMGWAGRAFIVANFDHQRLNDQLVECYHNLLSRPSQACAPVATTI